MGKRRDAEQFAALVQTGLERGMDVVAAWRTARAQRPSAQARALQAEHQRLATAQRREIERYDRRARRLNTQVTAGTAVAGVAGTVGVIDVVVEATTSSVGVYGPSWVWLATAVVGGVTAISARRARATLPESPRPEAALGPTSVLAADAIGASESQQLIAVRVQLARIVPAIDRLHPGAGAELRRADTEAAPTLHALVERLGILDRIRREMPDTSAYQAATSAALEVSQRLRTGAQTYERLVAASATMLAAPDIARSTDEVLGPALDALTAYTHGLQATAERFER